MSNFLNIGILVISLVLGGCGTTKNNTEKAIQSNHPFVIISATYSFSDNDSANRKKMDIQIAIDNAEVELDSIYFRKTAIELKRDVNSVPPVFTGNFLFSNIQKDYILHSDSQKEFGNTPPGNTSKFPFDLQKNEAVVSYLFNGEKRYYKISRIVEI